MAESNSNKDKNQLEKCACSKKLAAHDKAIKELQREIEILKKAIK